MQTKVGPALARAREGGRRTLPECPAAIAELMLQCWHADPSGRPTFAHIRRVLGEHVSGDPGGSAMRLPLASAATTLALEGCVGGREAVRTSATVRRWSSLD